MPDPHDTDEETHRKIAEAVLADPRHDHPTHLDKPIAHDEHAVSEPPPWAEDDKHPGPPGWHREPDGTGFVWVPDKP